MLFTCGWGRKTNTLQCYLLLTAIQVKALFRWKNVSHHQLKEKPGLLEGAFSDASAAHHPLEGQLFMEELKQTHQRETHGQNNGGREGQTKIENKGGHCEAPGQ